MGDTVRTDDLTIAEFPAASREQWLALVASVLKGAPFEKRLVSKTYDGISVAPLYERDDGARVVFGRKAGTPWRIVQRIEFTDTAAANAQALHDLENGATGLTLLFNGATGAYGFGLAGDASLERVLKGVVLDAGVAIDLQPGPHAADVARQLTDVIRGQGISPAAVNIGFGFDPIGEIAVGGGRAPSWSEESGRFAAAINGLVAEGYKGPFAVADGRVIHNAGGSEAQELAYVLATALAYLRALEASGVALGDVRRMICFRLAADADQFMTSAKFRALRKLWARIEEACGLLPAPVFIAAETAWRMMTRRDPFVNMLRATVAVVAAGLGGADSIAVVPHTAAIGLPDGFARRIARNTQLILLEESNLAKVADPAAGSGGLESLTQELCVTAWSLFQEIEKTGGAAALEQGLIQEKVAAVRADREKAIARRKDALTGTSAFPDIAEMPVEVLALSPLLPAPSPLVGEGRGGGSGGNAMQVPHSPTPTPTPDPSPQWGGEKSTLTPLPCRRLAEPFEALRDISDRALENTGARPKIFLANLGRLADFTARATYAKNFFEAGGIEAVTNDGFASRKEMLAAFRASGAKLACLCASDASYANDAVETAKALSGAGATHLYLAGRPGELEAALKEAGVGTFIYMGCNVVAMLIAAHDIY
ncbi:MAG TPA: methylmalonyl-CoA mutase subunit beta [Xanthobacteraceae bacterium]|nr:methylmalonyl-CoA mutase subunit beta [Xanthobacteraceae bacterium]